MDFADHLNERLLGDVVWVKGPDFRTVVARPPSGRLDQDWVPETQVAPSRGGWGAWLVLRPVWRLRLRGKSRQCVLRQHGLVPVPIKYSSALRDLPEASAAILELASLTATLTDMENENAA